MAERAVTELVIDARGAEVGSAAYVRAMNSAQAAVDRVIERENALGVAVERQVAVMTGGTTSISRRAAAWDNLRGAVDAVAKAEVAAQREMQRAIITTDNAVRSGITTHEQAARVLSALRQRQIAELNAVRDAAQRANAAQTAPVAANQNLRGAGSFNTGNIAAQFQDIAVTSAMGMSPLQIALQQGTQLSAVLGPMGAAGAAKSLGAALLSIVNPTSLVVLGLVGATAAAIQYFTKSKDDAKSLDDVLKSHADTIKRIEEVWGKAAVAADNYGKRSSSAAGFGLSSDIAAMEKRLRDMTAPGMFGGSEITDTITTATGEWLDDIGGPKAFRATEMFDLLATDLDAMIKSAREGSPDIIGFVRRIEELGAASGNAGIRGLAGEISTALREVEAFARALAEANRLKNELFNNVGPNGMLLSQGTANSADMGNLSRFESQEGVAAARRREAANAQLQGLLAKSPAERAAAARAAAGAQHSDESAAARADRIDIAGKMALAEAEKGLADARKDRARSLDATMAQQQLEISLIGQTAGEVARLRMEYDLTSKLKEEAARNGISVDEKELALIKEKAAAFGQYADQIARANLQRDLTFERDQLFRSPIDQTIASRQRGAGIGVNLDDEFAQQMRENMAFTQARDITKGFFTDLKAEFDKNGGDIGEAFGKAALNAATKIADRLWEQLFDELASSIASALTGTKAGGIGGAGSVVADIWSGLRGVANDNAAPQFLSGIGSPLISAGATKTGIPLSEVTAQGLTAKVTSEYASRFQGLFDDLSAAGYKISSLGEGGYSYRKVAGSNNLSRHAFGEAVDINPSANPHSYSGRMDFDDYGIDPDALARKNGLTWGGNWRKPDTMHFQVDKSAKMAAASLERVAQTGEAATQGLGDFGKNLSSMFPAAPSGGGGIGGFLSSLFGGGGFNQAAGMAISPLATAAIMSGGGGLYAQGAAFLHGNVVPFARGDVLTSPAYFPMSGGRTGIGGEAGPEAIMPLRRGADGRLGVAAANANARAVNVALNVINNSSTPVDANVEEEDDGNGGRRINLVLEDRMAAAMNRPGSAPNRALKARGATLPRPRR